MMATMSEIDDIFSFKAESKQKKKLSSTSKCVEEYSSKTRPLPETVVDTSADPLNRRKKNTIPSKKRPLPETVVDTSADLFGPSKRCKKDSIPNNSKPTKSKKSRERTAFGDSRGSGDRKSNLLSFWS